MEGSVLNILNIKHIKYVRKKKAIFKKNRGSMSKVDTVDNLDVDKLRKLASDMIEKQLLELSDNFYKIKGKDIIEQVLPEISET